MDRIDLWLERDATSADEARREARKHRRWMAVGIWCGVALAILGWVAQLSSSPPSLTLDWSLMMFPLLFFAAAAWEGALSLHWKERYLRLRGPAPTPPTPVAIS